jgi:hypothetical protein
MGIALAVFVLGMILIGFISLTLLPLLFIWLTVSVYAEPWDEPAVAGDAPATGMAGFGPLTEVETPPAEPTPTRPKVMTAGRRTPL